MTVPHLPFYFIRHGETDWNRRHILMGKNDIPLNQRGIEQSKLAAQWLKNKPIEHIVTSPLSRALKTADIIAEVLQIPITIIDNLKECDWGKKEGQPVDDCAIFDEWIAGHIHEGAEAAHDFDMRVKCALKDALNVSESVLIVAHGGVYCSIQRTLSMPLTNIKNCSPVYHRPPKHPNDLWFAHDIGDQE